MTEAEWLACPDPQPMLASLKGRTSERKLRLFAVACARLVWDQVPDPEMRMAVEAAERYAEAHASPEELEDTHHAIYCLATRGITGTGPGPYEWAQAMGVPFDVYESLWGLSLCCGFSPTGLSKIERMASWGAGARVTGQQQPALLRCVFGPLPFRSVPVDPAWLAWNGGTASRLARALYADRAFDRLPVLADALEDAGCTDPGLLAHCRSGGEHARGCWVIDLLLGKE